MSHAKKPAQLWVVSLDGKEVLVRHRREDSARVIAVKSMHITVREADHNDLRRLSETGCEVLGMPEKIDPRQTDWVEP